MKKKTLIIIIIAGGILLTAASILPNSIWNLHLNSLLRHPEVRTVELSDTMHITSSEEIAQLYSSGIFIDQNTAKNSRNEDFEKIKEMFHILVNQLEPDAKDYYHRLLETANLEYSSSRPINISTEQGQEYFNFADGQLSLYEENFTCYFYISFEQKTRTITAFSINFMFYDEGQYFNKIPYRTELIDGVSKYYSNLGINEKLYWVEAGDDFFNAYLYDSLYGYDGYDETEMNLYER